ncbi:hypothetical protein [Pseudomonas sp. SDO55104_S430]
MNTLFRSNPHQYQKQDDPLINLAHQLDIHKKRNNTLLLVYCSFFVIIALRHNKQVIEPPLIDSVAFALSFAFVFLTFLCFSRERSHAEKAYRNLQIYLSTLPDDRTLVSYQYSMEHNNHIFHITYSGAKRHYNVKYSSEGHLEITEYEGVPTLDFLNKTTIQQGKQP